MPSNTPQYAKKYQSEPKHKQRFNKLQQDRRAANVHTNRILATEYKNKPCLDCGNIFPTVCMDFDHVRGVKTNNVAAMIYNKPTAAVLEEISKCEVVCANCHRIRTASRRQLK